MNICCFRHVRIPRFSVYFFQSLLWILLYGSNYIDRELFAGRWAMSVRPMPEQMMSKLGYICPTDYKESIWIKWDKCHLNLMFRFMHVANSRNILISHSLPFKWKYAVSVSVRLVRSLYFLNWDRSVRSAVMYLSVVSKVWCCVHITL